MKAGLCIVMMLTLSLALRAQTPPPPPAFLGPSIPIFSSEKDSVDFAQLERTLEERTRLAVATQNNKQLDSINLARRAFLDARKYVWRTLYRQDRTYTPYQLLGSIANRDSITKISVLGNGRRTLPDSIYLYRNLQELELIGFRLSKVPVKLLRSSVLKQLTLHNNFPDSPLRLGRSKSLTTLIIRGDEKGMLPRSFRKLKRLTTLNLSRNNLTELPMTRGNRKLNSLVLTGNSITLDRYVPQARSLKSLDLNVNKVTVVPEWIRNFRNLKSINFNNNRVERIEAGIGEIAGLEEISLYRNNLAEVPPVLYTMTSLRVIDLYYNHISTVDKSIANWKNMEILYLANNELYSIPEEIGQLSKLRELYVHHNKLSSLPESIGNLKGLHVLRINNNRLVDWPVGMFELKSLVNFDCSYNLFETLPIENLSFHDLKILSIGHNPWNADTQQRIKLWADVLRENNTVVHLR